MTERDDAALLSAIAQRRDLEAFTELYQRYQKPAYNVAYHFVHNQALAEEAVQEAMLSVWESAAAYRADGSAKAWIFSIVTTRCLKVSRTQKRSLQREERKRAMERAESMTTASEGIEKEESIQALQGQMEKLADLERQLLTLFYGAELSQQEISKLLSIPQQTVSFKLRNALDRLKANLLEVGFGAVVPLMTPAGLNRALLTSYEPSPELCAKVLHRLQNPAHKIAQKMSQRSALRHVGKAPISGGVVAGVSALAAAAAAFVWAISSGGGTTVSNPPRSPMAPVSQVLPPAPQQIPPVHRLWSFEQGPTAELPAKSGAWQWKKQDDGLGAMDVPGGQMTAVPIPFQLSPQPLKVEITHFSVSRQGPASFDLQWIDHDMLVSYKVYRPSAKRAQAKQQIVKTPFFVIGRHIVAKVEDEVLFVAEYDRPYPASELFLFFKNTGIRSIEVTSLEPDQIPPEYRDVDALIRSFGPQDAKGDDAGKEMPPATSH